MKSGFVFVRIKLMSTMVQMKRLFIICAACLFLLIGCQQKEEPKVRKPSPAEAEHVQNQILQLQQIVRQDPKNLSTWIQLGDISMDSSRFYEAIDAYQKALALDEKNVNVRVDLGTCYRSIGKPDKAAEEYRKAIAINPNHINARRNLGIVLAFDLNDRKGAIKQLEEYLRLSPRASDAAQIGQLIERLKASG
jgi:cytochrome c-type biogenesis protein CcmH/NrfG